MEMKMLTFCIFNDVYTFAKQWQTMANNSDIRSHIRRHNKLQINWIKFEQEKKICALPYTIHFNQGRTAYK